MNIPNMLTLLRVLMIPLFVASFLTSKVYCAFSVAATDFSVINDFLITSYSLSVSLLIIVTFL